MSTSFKFPLIFSGIALVIALISCFVIFNVINDSSIGTDCTDVIGDGYAMGLDEEPVVIGHICNNEARDFATPRVAVSLSLAVAITTFGVARIFMRKNIKIIRKIGTLLLISALSAVLFLTIAFVTGVLIGGVLYTNESSMDLSIILLLIYFVVAEIISYFIINRIGRKA